MTSDEIRRNIVEETKTWLNTPFHHEGRIKGAGVDCLMLLAEVYERCGLISHVVPPHYPPDWHLHKDVERYLAGVTQFAQEIVGPPFPGDLVLFKSGRTFSHGAIVIEWPRVIHAYWAADEVVWGDANLHPLARLERKFFTLFPS